MLGYRSLVFSFELLAKFAVCDAWSFAMSIAFQKLRGDNHVIKKIILYSPSLFFLVLYSKVASFAVKMLIVPLKSIQNKVPVFSNYSLLMQLHTNYIFNLIPVLPLVQLWTKFLVDYFSTCDMFCCLGDNSSLCCLFLSTVVSVLYGVSLNRGDIRFCKL